MKLTVLIDNNTKSDLVPEWGLAVYIEYGRHKILLDTGASDKFLVNAQKLGIDISQVDFAVLSHAHYDHADGMPAFFEANATAPFYLREGSEENCYSREPGGDHYIGICRGTLEKYADRIRYAQGNLELAPGVVLIPHSTPGLDEIGAENGMYVQRDGRWEADDFAHEQSLVLDTEQGLFILNSCSHGGLDHIVREVKEALPGKKICAMLGGLHLFRKSETEVRQQAQRIRETGIEKIYTGHCTGEMPLNVLKEELGDSVEAFYSGMEIVL